jgi:hypothetical protein
LNLRIEKEGKHVILPTLLVAMISLSVGLTGTNRDLAIVPAANGLVVGPIHFVEIFFVAGQTWSVAHQEWERNSSSKRQSET